jgi:hypothetical protein
LEIADPSTIPQCITDRHVLTPRVCRAREQETLGQPQTTKNRAKSWRWLRRQGPPMWL